MLLWGEGKCFVVVVLREGKNQERISSVNNGPCLVPEI